MTEDELSQLVALGEGAYLEFKHRVPAPERIAREVIALANTHGGRLVIGVNDDGTIVGVKDAAEEEFVLRRAVEQYIDPPVLYETERVRISNTRDVIVVLVRESKRKPHFLGPARDGEPRPSYVRVEHMSVEASEEVIEYLREADVEEGVTFAFGEREQMLMRYIDQYGRITVDQFADMAGCARHEAMQTLIRLTRADILRIHPDERADFFTLAYSGGTEA